MKILIASGFFESELTSFREYSYSKELSALGHDVTLMCGDQSYIWYGSRDRLPITEPTRRDAEFQRMTGVRVLRRRVFFRVSDFVLYWPLVQEIARADVVHIIEFRQGITLFIALAARLYGKPVVYDHEQRGDRTARWYSRLDSRFRRLLIRAGAHCVDCMRHTVLANRDHFRSCTRRRVEEIFAPLGVDPKRFYFDAQERAAVRSELGLAADERVAVMSGKLHRLKRVPEVVAACRRAGVRLILVGTLAPDVARQLDALEPGREILLPQASAERLRAIYSASDVAIFTTFTVSYWEAHATGMNLVVPASAFSRLVFDGDPKVAQFGDPDMFRIPDELYRDDVAIEEEIFQALRRLRPGRRVSQTRFSAEEQCRRLSDLYSRLIAQRKGVQVA
jgi:glycosyltransferase involved in cell wall biosynthesis